MKIISNRKKFVESQYAPTDTNVIWVKPINSENLDNMQIGDMLHFVNGEWVSMLPPQDNGTQSVGFKLKMVIQDSLDNESVEGTVYVKSGILPKIMTPVRGSGWFIQTCPISTGTAYRSSFDIQETDDEQLWNPDTPTIKYNTKVVEFRGVVLKSEFSNSQAIWQIYSVVPPKEFLDLYEVK